MLNILDYLASQHPQIYKNTQYNIIEISAKLADRQAKRFDIRHVTSRHQNRVKVINKSIFDWNTPVNDDCFFIAMEVIVFTPYLLEISSLYRTTSRMI